MRARLVVAIPALAVAAIVIARGGLLFAAALLILGCICLDELYRLTARAHPAKLAGFVALFALLVAAHYGTRDQVLLIAVAALPASFLLTLVSPAGSIFGITVTLLGSGGSDWHWPMRCCCAICPTAAGSSPTRWSERSWGTPAPTWAGARSAGAGSRRRSRRTRRWRGS